MAANEAIASWDCRPWTSGLWRRTVDPTARPVGAVLGEMSGRQRVGTSMRQAAKRSARRVAAAGLIAALASLGGVLAAPSAGAATATGCSGAATSTDNDGNALDGVDVPGPHGTKSDPFEITSKGTVDWSGSTDEVIQDGKWTVYAWPFSFDGKIDNDDGNTQKSGNEKVDDRLPLPVPGLIFVKVTLTGKGGAECRATGWVRITDSPMSSAVFWFAALLMLFGFLGWILLMMGFRSGAAPVSPADTATAETLTETARLSVADELYPKHDPPGSTPDEEGAP